MTYSDKLKDPRWQKMRLEVFNRDDFKCVLCGDTSETLHAHHIFYEKDHEPWEYDTRHIQTLCESCHERIHGGFKEAMIFLFDVIGDLMWKIRRHELSYSYDVSGILRFIGKDFLSVGDEFFDGYEARRKYNKENGNIEFELTKDWPKAS